MVVNPEEAEVGLDVLDAHVQHRPRFAASSSPPDDNVTGAPLERDSHWLARLSVHRNGVANKETSARPDYASASCEQIPRGCKNLFDKLCHEVLIIRFHVANDGGASALIGNGGIRRASWAVGNWKSAIRHTCGRPAAGRCKRSGRSQSEGTEDLANFRLIVQRHQELAFEHLQAFW
jgi:hypothetical protein